MKRLCSLILIKVCLVSSLLVAPGGAAVPPNYLIYASQFGNHIINIQVWDNYLNSYVYYTYDINDSNYNISDLKTSNNGIVRWIETSHNDYPYPYMRFCHLLYNPTAVNKWPIGYSYDFNPLNPLSYQEVDGIVCGRGIYYVLNEPYNGTYFSTYDPVDEKWVWVHSHNITAPSEQNTPYDPVIKDGIVAFKMGSWPNWVNTRYFIYDYQPWYQSGLRGWRGGVFSGDCDSLSIESCSVKIVVGSSTYYRGYNPDTGYWQDGGSGTKSYFFATPTSGRKPLWVWFWDLSMGAYFSKLWNFGDGTTNGTPSYYHSYTKPGKYQVKQFVTGSYFDVTSTTINVIGQGIPALPLMLLD